MEQNKEFVTVSSHLEHKPHWKLIKRKLDLEPNLLYPCFLFYMKKCPEQNLTNKHCHDCSFAQNDHEKFLANRSFDPESKSTIVIPAQNLIRSEAKQKRGFFGNRVATIVFEHANGEVVFRETIGEQ